MRERERERENKATAECRMEMIIGNHLVLTEAMNL